MYTIYYLEDEKKVGNTDEAIAFLEKLDKENIVTSHMVVIDTDELGTMEIGLGMSGDSVVLYIPVSEDEDLKISCNAYVDRAKSDEVTLSHPSGDEFECSASNLVNLNDALEVVEMFLNGVDFFDKLDWYAY